jgi:2-polyprenyl-3-methyl-5-hydroxy-6-metoxy-1,4-benzoquinol methylase
MTEQLQSRTIADFGEQWTAYPDSDGFFGSPALFNDFFNPLVFDRDVVGCRVAEIGAGGGRFVNVLAQAGSAHIVAVEPSDAFRVLQENTVQFRNQITYLKTTGDRLPDTGDLDYVFAIGVLHHIPDPDPVVAAASRALRRGGKLAVWLYGREGNAIYLTFVRSLWWLTRHLPHRGLDLFVRILYPLFWCYMTACRWIKLPLAEYMRRVMCPLTPAKRRLVIYDQLNPAYAKYYTREEARDLLTRQGFVDIRLHHRHGISWTVLGTKA